MVYPVNFDAQLTAQGGADDELPLQADKPCYFEAKARLKETTHMRKGSGSELEVRYKHLLSSPNERRPVCKKQHRNVPNKHYSGKPIE